jgi:hypothetical protein
MIKLISGFKKKQLRDAAILVVVSEEGTYDYLATRSLHEVVLALQNIIRDLEQHLDQEGE